jgi:hypothetical protein
MWSLPLSTVVNVADDSTGSLADGDADGVGVEADPELPQAASKETLRTVPRARQAAFFILFI